MKNFKILFILFVLVVIAAIYFFSNSKGTLKLSNTSFAIESIDKVASIKITKGTKELLLEKEMNSWKVNNKYKVKEWNIRNFLMALNRIDLLAPVSKVEKDQISSILKSDGILIEISGKNKNLRKYYVSKPGMNKSKTYMMMYKSSEPFIVRIPSFQGLVADLFVVDENYWRDKTVFDYQPQNIKNIKVESFEDPSKSFRVINYNNGTFALQNLNEDKFVKEFNVDKVARYFTYFQKISFDNVENKLNRDQVDSVLKSTPYMKISVEDIYGITNSVTIFRKPPEQELDEFGQKATFDYNRAYAVFNESNELIIIQYYIFDPLFKEIDYFR